MEVLTGKGSNVTILLFIEAGQEQGQGQGKEQGQGQDGERGRDHFPHHDDTPAKGTGSSAIKLAKKEKEGAVGSQSDQIDSVLFLSLSGTDRCAAAEGWMNFLSPVTKTASASLSDHFYRAAASVTMQRLARDCGFSISHHRARMLSLREAKDFDRVVLFDKADYDEFRNICWGTNLFRKARLLMNYHSTFSERNIADPYEHGESKLAFGLIEKGIRAMIDKENMLSVEDGLLDVLTSLRSKLKVSNNCIEEQRILLEEKKEYGKKIPRMKLQLRKQATEASHLVEANISLKHQVKDLLREKEELVQKLTALDQQIRHKEAAENVGQQRVQALTKNISQKNAEIRSLKRELKQTLSRLKNETLARRTLENRITEMLHSVN